MYKKGDRNNLGNYRPVSILPVFSKGLEKLIHARLASFAEKTKIITEAQYGFRPHRSTQMALLDQKEYILKNIESKTFVLGIFIDFTKAFDYLSRDLLLDKLSSYGIRGQSLQLIKSYLSHRFQFVKNNGYSSTLLHTRNGVPQGSVLGPFLFNVYINDIVDINSRAKFVIYHLKPALNFVI